MSDTSLPKPSAPPSQNKGTPSGPQGSDKTKPKAVFSAPSDKETTKPSGGNNNVSPPLKKNNPTPNANTNKSKQGLTTASKPGEQKVPPKNTSEGKPVPKPNRPTNSAGQPLPGDKLPGIQKPTAPIQQQSAQPGTNPLAGDQKKPLLKPVVPPSQNQKEQATSSGSSIQKPSVPTPISPVKPTGVTSPANKTPTGAVQGMSAPKPPEPNATTVVTEPGLKPGGQQMRPLRSNPPSGDTIPPKPIQGAPAIAPITKLGMTTPTNLTPGSPGQKPPASSVMRPPANLTALRTVSSNNLPPGATAAPTATPKQAAPQQKKAVFATATKSPLRFLPYIIGGVVLLLIIGFLSFRFFSSTEEEPDTTVPRRTPAASTNPDTGRTVVPGTQKTITYWGLWEPEEIIEGIIEDFEADNPDIDVVFIPQSHKDYRERLQTAISSGQGPDVFRFHASWTPMLSEELYPVPASVLSSSEFQATYYPVMAKQLQNNGQFVGIPLMYDGLALYYNEDILSTASEQPPQTWSELRTLAAKLTIRSGNEVKRGGVALGNATNVEHFSDILAVLMLQNGADLANPNTPEGRDALKFYTNFLKEDKVWSESLPSSTVAFARGDVAMMFAPSWRAHEIQAINPDLKFGVTTLPRLAETRISWATYWAEGVNARSENTDEAWQFVQYLASEEALQEAYSAQSGVRSFGELYPRVNMADSLALDPIVAPFLQDAPYAKGWYMSSYTHDNGVNDLIIKYYEDAVTAVLGTTTTEDAMTTVDQGVKQVLRQYNAQ